MTITYWQPTPVAPFQNGTYAITDDGWLGGNSDPGTISGGGLLSAGSLYLQRIELRAAALITNLWYDVTTIGAGASTGSFVGLWSSAGTLLSGSADVGAAFAGVTGWQSFPLTTPQALPAGGFVWAGVLCNLATTQVTMGRQANSAVEALGGPTSGPSTLRWAIRGAFGTALASFAPAGNAVTAFTLAVAWN